MNTNDDDGDIARVEAELVNRFREYYQNTDNEVLRELERRTLGAAYGGNGYTDIHQVEHLVSILDVDEGDRVLELGSGAGWPGLYIARHTRSKVVLSDVPWEGVAWGRRRGRSEGIPVDAVACLGSEIPFRDGSFEGVTHSDVMCWLWDKLSVLRACNRVLVSGGRLVFDVVSMPDALSGHDDLEADYGFVATAVPYPELLVQAGFTNIGSEDTTPGYLEVAGRWLAAARGLEPELRIAMGDEVFDDKYASRFESYEMIKSGELERTLYWATARRGP